MVEKRQNMSHKKSYFEHQIFLHSPDENSIIHGKTLCSHSMRRCTREFSCLKFDILKCLKDAFQNKGGICNQGTKHHSQQWKFLFDATKIWDFPSRHARLVLVS
jgi:hypothetical protein